MQVLEAQYEIVTPMFIGGANQHDEPEIRPPSIKGALRFWWRAIQWGACLKEQGGDANAALARLYELEAALFGAAAKEDKFGQGKVSLKVHFNKDQSQLKISQKQAIVPNLDGGQSYLLGQGIYHFRDGFLRDALSPNQSFKVILKLKDDVETDSLIKTLIAFGLLGGLGSRARKGWGSIAIRSLSHTDKEKNSHSISVPKDKDEYKKCLIELFSAATDSIPPFTAISKHTRIDLSITADKPLLVLSKIGNEMQNYRSYGRKKGDQHTVNSKPAEQNFKRDHDVVLEFSQGKPIKTHPKRLIFGLPHNYFYSNGTKVDVDAEKFSRRASPLIIHIHQFPSGQTIGVQCLLKSAFLPEHERIQLKHKQKSQAVACDVDWKVIDTYLDRFTQGERII